MPSICCSNTLYLYAVVTPQKDSTCTRWADAILVIEQSFSYYLLRLVFRTYACSQFFFTCSVVVFNINATSNEQQYSRYSKERLYIS